jgi:flagellar biogenesis protein FliO
MKNDNILVAVMVVVIALLLFGGFGMMGFGGFGHMGYGSQTLCSNVGGIWCYWPNWMGVFSFLFMILIFVVMTLLIIWLARQLFQNEKRHKRSHK